MAILLRTAIRSWIAAGVNEDLPEIYDRQDQKARFSKLKLNDFALLINNGIEPACQDWGINFPT